MLPLEKKKKPEDPYADFREMEKRIQKIMEDIMVDVELPEAMFDAKKKRPFVMGFSLKMGPKRSIKIRELSGKRPKRPVPKQRQPLFETLEFGEKITIIGELPGSKKGDITVRARGQKVSIIVGGEMPYYHEIELEHSVKKRVKKSFNNGILEITLEKARGGKNERARIY